LVDLFVYIMMMHRLTNLKFIDVDVKCTVTVLVKQFDFVIISIMLFNILHLVMSVKQ
jgi:hypothetical protein